MNTVVTEKVKRVNDKGERIPEKCPKCGSKIGLYIKGEPVWLCSNKDCKKYYGTLPFTESVYDKPYSYDEIVSNYGKNVADKLMKDPAHKYRADTGIELIHKEPSLNELERIYKNWLLMNDSMKKESDKKSIQLFGCDNTTNYNNLRKTYQERTERNTMYDNILGNMMNQFFGEAGDNNKIPDLIEPVVKILESKGYKVKYASPGHENTRFDNDRDKDRVINAKFATTGRIIFSRNYDFPSTPQGWTWKALENGAKALYTKPYTYNEKQGSQKEAFLKWQTFYIDSVKTWANSLPKAGSGKEPTQPDTNFSK